jgi:hypothetical protein
MFSTAQILTLVVAVVIPILNGLLTKYNAVKARAYLQLLMNSVNGFAMEWLDAVNTGTEYNVGHAVLGTVVSLVVAVAVQAGLWAPLGVSEKAKSAGVR